MAFPPQFLNPCWNLCKIDMSPLRGRRHNVLDIQRSWHEPRTSGFHICSLFGLRCLDDNCLDRQAARGPSSVLADRPLPNTAMRARLQKAWNVCVTQRDLHSLPARPKMGIKPKMGLVRGNLNHLACHTCPCRVRVQLPMHNQDWDFHLVMWRMQKRDTTGEQGRMSWTR